MKLKKIFEQINYKKSNITNSDIINTVTKASDFYGTTSIIDSKLIFKKVDFHCQ